MNEMFREALPVLKKIEDEGFKAYFVGGCVRDLYLERPIKDIDIATSARPEEIQIIFPKTIPVGIEHGTVIVRHNHVSYEITTFRKEDKYEDYRRPSKVWFVDDLQEDLSRRDFTFNAMAMDTSLRLIDHFGGRDDLKLRQIRTVGNPHLRFSEDPLRVMRACRFMSVYDMKIEAETKKAIETKAPLLKKISTERISIEFIKLLQGVQAGHALEFMKQSTVVEYLPYPLKEQMNEGYLGLEWTKLQTDDQRWAAIILLSQVKDSREFLKRWKLPNGTIKKVQELLAAFSVKKWSKIDLYRTGISLALESMTLKSTIEKVDYDQEKDDLQKLACEIPITSLKDLPIDGEEILKIKQKSPGVWLGKLLHEMEEKIVNGDLSTSETVIKDWVKRWEP